ncbi:hypothetical protein Dimus_020882 [Dionaea muscipula]
MGPVALNVWVILGCQRWPIRRGGRRPNCWPTRWWLEDSYWPVTSLARRSQRGGTLVSLSNSSRWRFWVVVRWFWAAAGGAVVFCGGCRWFVRCGGGFGVAELVQHSPVPIPAAAAMGPSGPRWSGRLGISDDFLWVILGCRGGRFGRGGRRPNCWPTRSWLEDSHRSGTSSHVVLCVVGLWRAWATARGGGFEWSRGELGRSSGAVVFCGGCRWFGSCGGGFGSPQLAQLTGVRFRLLPAMGAVALDGGSGTVVVVLGRVSSAKNSPVSDS